MGEIRIVGPGKTRGYPAYPVCKKRMVIRCARKNGSALYVLCDRPVNSVVFNIFICSRSFVPVLPNVFHFVSTYLF